MKIVENTHNGIPVFALKGKIMDWDKGSLLRGKIVESLTAGNKRIVLDLSGVDWVNSVGLGLLVSIHSTVLKAGGSLALANIQNIEKILTTTKLVTIFDVFDSLDEALATSG